MEKRKLKNVTLLGIDCLDVERLKISMDICQTDFEFAEVKLLTSLDVANKENIVKIQSINSIEEYSYFVINDLWRYVDTTHVLLVHNEKERLRWL